MYLFRLERPFPSAYSTLYKHLKSNSLVFFFFKFSSSGWSNQFESNSRWTVTGRERGKHNKNNCKVQHLGIYSSSQSWGNLTLWLRKINLVYTNQTETLVQWLRLGTFTARPRLRPWFGNEGPASCEKQQTKCIGKNFMRYAY